MGVEGVTPGTAFTLITNEDRGFACLLIKHLRASDQPVSDELIAVGGRGSSDGGRVKSDNAVRGDNRTRHLTTNRPTDLVSYNESAGTALPGFVRATRAYSSSVVVSRNNSDVRSRKQSRWS